LNRPIGDGAIRHDQPKFVRALRTEIPAGLAAVVSRCLEKDPAHRYQRASDLLIDVRTIQRGGVVRRRLSVGRARRYGGAAVLLAATVVAGVSVRTRPEARVRSLAVLPVSASTGDSTHDALSDGMTDLLINRLSQLSGLRRVISRTSVARYKHTQKSSRQIARELGVDALVEMSVMRVGERVRMTVSLVGTEADRVLRSRSFERLEGDVLTLQREAAQAIAQALQVQLTPQETARLTAAAPKVNPEAFALYLRSARGEVPDGGTSYIEQAIAKALALDPNFSDAYGALGMLRGWVDRDWLAAEEAFRHAIELNPHNSGAHHELGQLFMRLGRCDEAVEEEQCAVLQNPGVGHYQSGLAEVYAFCRHYDEAIREFEKNLDLVSDSLLTTFNIGDAYFYQGNYAQALAMYEKSGWPVPGWAYASLGRREARKWIAMSEAEWHGAERRSGVRRAKFGAVRARKATLNYVGRCHFHTRRRSARVRQPLGRRPRSCPPTRSMMARA
jgi:TolB-like protein